MIQLKSCCRVSFPERLFEQYEIRSNEIVANVGAGKILKMMKRFIDEHEEPMFFILEIPARLTDESEKQPGVLEHSYKDIYYLDGLSQNSALSLLSSLGEFLAADGMNTFGFGGHRSQEEILFCPYNVTHLYSLENVEKFESFLRAFDLERVDSLVTAWDTFDREHPGECFTHEAEGKTIYDIPATFAEHGLYLAERRDEDGNVVPIHPDTMEELIGKTMLIGITYYTKDEELIEQKQYWGEVVEATEDHICIRQTDGELFQIPADRKAVEQARRGEYRLRSTGEIVVNPDYLSSWSVTKGD